MKIINKNIIKQIKTKISIIGVFHIRLIVALCISDDMKVKQNLKRSQAVIKPGSSHTEDESNQRLTYRHVRSCHLITMWYICGCYRLLFGSSQKN